MLKLEKVSKILGDREVLSDLSFELSKGEVVGLLGPNGAGKTTTMRVLAGYFFSDSGKVEFEGKSIYENFEDYKNNVGFMPESNPLYKELSVQDSINSALDFKGISEVETRKSEIDRVVKATGISEVFFKRVSELSKGYKQRLGIAIAIIGKPKIIILDEPTEGLDPLQRNEIRNLIKSLAEDSLVLVSTHVLQEVDALCSRIILINKGKIIADGSLQSLRENSSRYNIHILEDKVKKELFAEFEPSIEESKEGTKLSLKVKSGNDEIVKINKVLRENSLNVVSMQPGNTNLEELFIKLKE